MSNYYLRSNRQAQIRAQLHEEDRLRRNRRLMEAYGDKGNLGDVERAMEVYEVQ